MGMNVMKKKKSVPLNVDGCINLSKQIVENCRNEKQRVFLVL